MITKEVLSGSTRGSGVPVIETSSPGTTIHTTGVSASVTDEVWLYATNYDTVPRNLTIEWGLTGSVNEIKLSLSSRTALSLIVPGLVLTGDGSTGQTITAYAGTSASVTVFGFVNRIEI